MAQRKFNFEIDSYYHLYSRGTDKRPIFLSGNDYQRFIGTLYSANGTEFIRLSDLGQWSRRVWEMDRGETIVDIGAYCLMPNHFHLLVREKQESGITNFMQRLLTSYSLYFNLKNERTGKLFEGPFKATEVDNDPYLQYLYSYIHLNPVKVANPEGWPAKIVEDSKEAKAFLDTYPYSSYHDYLMRERKEGKIINREVFPGYFEGEPDFSEFLNDWMQYDQPLK